MHRLFRLLLDPTAPGEGVAVAAPAAPAAAQPAAPAATPPDVQALMSELARLKASQAAAETAAEVARGMGEIKFVNAHARQVFEREIVQSIAAGGASGIPVADLIRAAAANPERAYLLAPKGLAGTAGGQPAQVPPVPGFSQAASVDAASATYWSGPGAANLGQATIAHMLKQQAEQQATGGPAVNTSKAFGLSRTK